MCLSSPTIIYESYVNGVLDLILLYCACVNDIIFSPSIVSYFLVFSISFALISMAFLSLSFLISL